MHHTSWYSLHFSSKILWNNSILELKATFTGLVKPPNIASFNFFTEQKFIFCPSHLPSVKKETKPKTLVKQCVEYQNKSLPSLNYVQKYVSFLHQVWHFLRSWVASTLFFSAKEIGPDG